MGAGGGPLQCTFSDGTCTGNECCPPSEYFGGKTYPCPAADRCFDGCDISFCSRAVDRELGSELQWLSSCDNPAGQQSTQQDATWPRNWHLHQDETNIQLDHRYGARDAVDVAVRRCIPVRAPAADQLGLAQDSIIFIQHRRGQSSTRHELYCFAILAAAVSWGCRTLGCWLYALCCRCCKSRAPCNAFRSKSYWDDEHKIRMVYLESNHPQYWCYRHEPSMRRCRCS